MIVTHHDIDHIGGLADLHKALPRPLTVLAHGVEKPFIEREQTLLKLALRRLASYSIEKIIAYHGGLYSGNNNQRIRLLTSAVNGEA